MQVVTSRGTRVSDVASLHQEQDNPRVPYQLASGELSSTSEPKFVTIPSRVTGSNQDSNMSAECQIQHLCL